MNQIYKVVFSHVHRCFVAVSEIVKQAGKSSSGKNRKQLFVALGFALAASGAMAESKLYIGEPSNNKYELIVNQSGVIEKGLLYSVGSAVGMQVTDSDTLTGSYGTPSSAKNGLVEVNGGTAGHVYGGNVSAISGTEGEVGDNIVTINRDATVEAVHGGRSVSIAVQNNNVTINGGTVSNADITYGGNFTLSKGGVIGGVSSIGTSTGNSVEIKGDAKINGIYPVVAGAFSTLGNVSKNRVTIDGVSSDKNVKALAVFGGMGHLIVCCGKLFESIAVLGSSDGLLKMLHSKSDCKGLLFKDQLLSGKHFERVPCTVAYGCNENTRRYSFDAAVM